VPLYEGHHNSAVFRGYERSSGAAIFVYLIGCDYRWHHGARRCTRICVARRPLCPADVPTRSDV